MAPFPASSRDPRTSSSIASFIERSSGPAASPAAISSCKTAPTDRFPEGDRALPGNGGAGRRGGRPALALAPHTGRSSHLADAPRLTAGLHGTLLSTPQVPPAWLHHHRRAWLTGTSPAPGSCPIAVRDTRHRQRGPDAAGDRRRLRADRHALTRRSLLGLGLSYEPGIVDLHAARLLVESDGRGSGRVLHRSPSHRNRNRAGDLEENRRLVLPRPAGSAADAFTERTAPCTFALVARSRGPRRSPVWTCCV